MAKTKPDTEQDRVVDRTDNKPPEVLPLQLASKDEIPTMIKGDLQQLTETAVLELDTFSRVPERIESDEIYQRVTTLATRVKGVIDDVELRRGKHKRPYLDATKLIDDIFKLTLPVKDGKDRVLRKELDGAHAALKARLSDFDTRQYLAQQAEIEAERTRLADEAAKDGIQISGEAVAPAIASTVKSAHGGQSVRRVVDEWAVVDETLLPRSVLSVDPAKVQKLLDEGAVEIPGIQISKKVETYVKK
jgi:hypothetical protein